MSDTAPGINLAASSDEEPSWSSEELEAAYLRALDALEAVESEVVATAEEIAPGRLDALSSEPVDTPVAPPIVSSREHVEAGPSVTAEQILEACLFVGGPSLTATKLAGILRGDYTSERVEGALGTINTRYQEEGRPYELRYESGGYRLALLPDYERVREKVYGQGPKEVRLSQETLEILALVAYHQPVTEVQLADLGRPQAGPTLRLLLRRELLVIERNSQDGKEIRYRTTERFLSLFGLKSLAELPRPDDLSFK
jgi:segregation and condensation protein B